MGQVIDLRAARAVKTSKETLERLLKERAEQSPKTIDWPAVCGIRLTGPGGIDDLEF